MNVALPALIVFFLLLPGFIFRTNLKRAERTSLFVLRYSEAITLNIQYARLIPEEQGDGPAMP
jgi:hypothetical protein